MNHTTTQQPLERATKAVPTFPLSLIRLPMMKMTMEVGMVTAMAVEEMVGVEIMVVGTAVVEEVVAAVVVVHVPLGHRRISIPHRSSSRT